MKKEPPSLLIELFFSVKRELAHALDILKIERKNHTPVTA